MKNGMLVFDAVVHAMDFRKEMHVNADAQRIVDVMYGFLGWTARNGQVVNYEGLERPPAHDWANQMLFEESDTDLACVMAIPLFSMFRDGMGPARIAYELAQSRPDRYYFCGAVDPLYQGLHGALDEMERQVKEWGAVSIKFYQSQSIRHSWRADDEKIAYPLWEKAIQLGIKTVQFHKGLPVGPQRVEDLRPNDLQQAAYDFPQLNFAIHHMGEPYVDETINIAARFPNIYLIMPLWFNQYFVQPKLMLHRLGSALLQVGEDRICYGTDAFLWPKVQTYINLLAELQIPEQMQEDYGYPAITETTRRKIFGENYARALGIDLEAKRKELGLSR